MEIQEIGGLRSGHQEGGALGRDPFVDGITVVGDDGEYDSIEQVWAE